MLQSEPVPLPATAPAKEVDQLLSAKLPLTVVVLTVPPAVTPKAAPKVTSEYTTLAGIDLIGPTVAELPAAAVEVTYTQEGPKYAAVLLRLIMLIVSRLAAPSVTGALCVYQVTTAGFVSSAVHEADLL